MRKIFTSAFAIIAAVVASGSVVAAAEIKIISSPAAKEALTELVPAFEKATGHKVTITWAGSGAGEKRVMDGENADLVIIATENVDKLIAAGKVSSGSNTPFVKTGVGIALKVGLPRPDVSTPEGVKNAVLAAKSVAYSQGPSGFYVAELFKKLGVAEAVKDKLTQTSSGVQIADLVAEGKVDLGFQQVSEMIHHKGIQFLGPLPKEIQHYTVFSFGTVASSASQDAAKAFVNFMRSDAAALLIKTKGLEPG